MTALKSRKSSLVAVTAASAAATLLVLFTGTHLRSAAELRPRMLEPPPAHDQTIAEMQALRPEPKPREGAPEYAFEMRWHDSNPRYKVCRLHNACVANDGTVVLDASMRAFQSEMASCNLHKVSFQEGGVEGALYRALDLFGVSPAPQHIPHFLTDVLPFMYASELLEPTFTPRREIREFCSVMNGKRCGVNVAPAKFNSALFTADKVSEMPLSHWVPQLVSLLPQRPRLVFQSELLKEEPLACFRSIVAYEQDNEIREGAQWFGEEHKLFTENGLTRRSLAKSRRKSLSPLDRRCKGNVAILNRQGWLKVKGNEIGRDIANVDELLSSLRELQNSDRFKNTVNANVSVVYFENLTFAEQVQTMQNAEVVLGAHGAGMSNLLFSRIGTRVIEVYPFGYTPNFFERLAKGLYLQYEHVIADPDDAGVESCINKATLRRDSEIHKTTARSVWRRAMRSLQSGRGAMGSLQAQNFKYSSAPLWMLKNCVRSQRMNIDAKYGARRLLESVESLCL